MRDTDRRWNRNTRELFKSRVEALLARGLRECEIVETLCLPTKPDGSLNNNAVANPRTGNPYDRSTARRCIKEIWVEWRQAGLANSEEQRGEIIGENKAASRRAWARDDLSEIRQFLDQRARFYGIATETEKESQVTVIIKTEPGDLAEKLEKDNAEFQDQSA